LEREGDFFESLLVCVRLLELLVLESTAKTRESEGFFVVLLVLLVDLSGDCLLLEDFVGSLDGWAVVVERFAGNWGRVAFFMVVGRWAEVTCLLILV